MSAGVVVVPNKALLNLVNATGLLAANSANWRIALVSSAWTPNNTDAGNEVWADISSHEIAAEGGYAAGGKALTGVTLVLASGKAKFSSSSVTWLAAGGDIPAWRRGVIYWAGTLNGKVNPVLGHFLGDIGDLDVPATVSGTTLTITPNALGLVALSLGS